MGEYENMIKLSTFSRMMPNLILRSHLGELDKRWDEDASLRGMYADMVWLAEEQWFMGDLFDHEDSNISWIKEIWSTVVTSMVPWALLFSLWKFGYTALVWAHLAGKWATVATLSKSAEIWVRSWAAYLGATEYQAWAWNYVRSMKWYGEFVAFDVMLWVAWRLRARAHWVKNQNIFKDLKSGDLYNNGGWSKSVLENSTRHKFKIWLAEVAALSGTAYAWAQLIREFKWVDLELDPTEFSEDELASALMMVFMIHGWQKLEGKMSRRYEVSKWLDGKPSVKLFSWAIEKAKWLKDTAVAWTKKRLDNSKTVQKAKTGIEKRRPKNGLDLDENIIFKQLSKKSKKEWWKLTNSTEHNQLLFLTAKKNLFSVEKQLKDIENKLWNGKQNNNLSKAKKQTLLIKKEWLIEQKKWLERIVNAQKELDKVWLDKMNNNKKKVDTVKKSDITPEGKYDYVKTELQKNLSEIEKLKVSTDPKDQARLVVLKKETTAYKRTITVYEKTYLPEVHIKKLDADIKAAKTPASKARLEAKKQKYNYDSAKKWLKKVSTEISKLEGSTKAADIKQLKILVAEKATYNRTIKAYVEKNLPAEHLTMLNDKISKAKGSNKTEIEKQFIEYRKLHPEGYKKFMNKQIGIIEKEIKRLQENVKPTEKVTKAIKSLEEQVIFYKKELAK